MTSKDIKRAIRELRAEMKQAGIRRVSCFNGGLDMQTYRYNARMFDLKLKLEITENLEANEARFNAA